MTNILFQQHSFSAFCYTNILTTKGGGLSIQVVFVPTSGFGSNVSASVLFIPGVGGPVSPIVQIAQSEFDPVFNTTTTNAVYFVDNIAVDTNRTKLGFDDFVFFGVATGTARPEVYDIYRDPAFAGWDFAFHRPMQITHPRCCTAPIMSPML